MRNLIVFASVFVVSLVLMVAVAPKKTSPQPVIPQPIVEVQPVDPGPYEITRQTPDKFYNYDEVIALMKEWNQQAPEITAFGTYGKNRQGTDLTYLRIGTPGMPKLLIHASIHGNERLSTSSTLGIMGRILHNYQRDEEVTWLVKNRDVYFVPVFSPESYLRSRHIEQGDPNRNWPYPGSRSDNTSSPIVEMRKFFLQEQFCAVIDGHTTGRDFFWPSLAKGSDRQKYDDLATGMAELAGYDPSPISNGPAGYAIDWYYWKGAVAILTEFGTGGHDQPERNILPEIEKTYKAYLYFIKHAPEIKLDGIGDMRYGAWNDWREE